MNTPPAPEARPCVQPPPASSEGLAIARQAILDEQRAVYGYELFDRTTAAGGYTVETDATLLFNALSYAGAELLMDRKTVFINCTHASLQGEHLDLVHPEKVVLKLPIFDTEATPEQIEGFVPMLQALRDKGFRLAFNQNVLRRGYGNWLAHAAFIKLDLQAFAAELTEPLVKFSRTHTHATLIAEKVETVEQYERMKALGVTLFQGYWFAQPTVVHTPSARPAQAIIIGLINLVRKEAEIDDIENLLKKDPTLSFNLLRFINSSGFGLQVQVTSFRHAVMILGMKKLFRWAALLLTTSRASGSPPAVGQTAVVRGRLMELLAAELLSQEDVDNAFVIGVFSLLDVMLGMPIERALKSISLPGSATDALLHNRGLFAPFLELTRACESGDEEAFARSAQALQLTSHQVNWAHLQALAWAESLGDE